MDWKKLLGSITESVDEELWLRNAYLLVENRILRQQVKGCLSLTDSARKELAAIGQQLGKQVLEEIATVAKPETILSWNRQFATQKWDGATPRKSAGRPPALTRRSRIWWRGWPERTARGAMTASREL